MVANEIQEDSEAMREMRKTTSTPGNAPKSLAVCEPSRAVSRGADLNPMVDLGICSLEAFPPKPSLVEKDNGSSSGQIHHVEKDIGSSSGRSQIEDAEYVDDSSQASSGTTQSATQSTTPSEEGPRVPKTPSKESEREWKDRMSAEWHMLTNQTGSPDVRLNKAPKTSSPENGTTRETLHGTDVSAPSSPGEDKPSESSPTQTSSPLVAEAKAVEEDLRVVLAPDDDLSEDEEVDDRVEYYLEQLNLSAEEVNKYETALIAARRHWLHVGAETERQCQQIAKSLKRNIVKATSYYHKQKVAQTLKKQTQDTMQGYNHASEVHINAKEELTRAEAAAMRSKLDPHLQTLMNTAAATIMEAQGHRDAAAAAHQVQVDKSAAMIAELDAIVRSSKLLAWNIRQAKPYFAAKELSDHLRAEAHHQVLDIEAQLNTTKESYTNALNMLNQISEEVHHSRIRRKQRRRTLETGEEAEQEEVPSGEEEVEQVLVWSPRGSAGGGIKVVHEVQREEGSKRTLVEEDAQQKEGLESIQANDDAQWEEGSESTQPRDDAQWEEGSESTLVEDDTQWEDGSGRGESERASVEDDAQQQGISAERAPVKDDAQPRDEVQREEGEASTLVEDDAQPRADAQRQEVSESTLVEEGDAQPREDAQRQEVSEITLVEEGDAQPRKDAQRQGGSESTLVKEGDAQPREDAHRQGVSESTLVEEGDAQPREDAQPRVEGSESTLVDEDVQRVEGSESTLVDEDVQWVEGSESTLVDDDVQRVEGSESTLVGDNVQRVEGSESTLVDDDVHRVEGSESTLVDDDVKRVKRSESTLVDDDVQRVKGSESTLVDDDVQRAEGSESTLVDDDVQRVEGSESTLVDDDVQRVEGSESTLVGDDVQRVEGSESTLVDDDVKRVKGSESTLVGDDVQRVEGSESTLVDDDVQQLEGSERSPLEEDAQPRDNALRQGVSERALAGEDDAQLEGVLKRASSGEAKHAGRVESDPLGMAEWESPMDHSNWAME